MKQLKFIFLFACSIMAVAFCHTSCSNCSNPDDRANDTVIVNDVIYNIAKVSDLYTEPSEQAEKLSDEKASKILKSPYYLFVDEKCKVVVLETKDNWSKIQIVEPALFKDTHIGWVKNEVLSLTTGASQTKRSFKENEDYQVLFSKEADGVTNHYILLLETGYEKNALNALAKILSEKLSNKEKNNFLFFDNKEAATMHDKKPLIGRDYVNVADHFVYIYSFNKVGMKYPYKNDKYKQHGGKNAVR